MNKCTGFAQKNLGEPSKLIFGKSWAFGRRYQYCVYLGSKDFPFSMHNKNFIQVSLFISYIIPPFRSVMHGQHQLIKSRVCPFLWSHFYKSLQRHYSSNHNDASYLAGLSKWKTHILHHLKCQIPKIKIFAKYAPFKEN